MQTTERLPKRALRQVCAASRGTIAASAIAPVQPKQLADRVHREAKHEGMGNESETVEVLAIEGEASGAIASATWRSGRTVRSGVDIQVSATHHPRKMRAAGISGTATTSLSREANAVLLAMLPYAFVLGTAR